MIFYFSGTGNTRWVAEQIADAIGEELVYIPDAIRNDKYEYTITEEETIGFCFPTHGWQPPHIVRQFIAKLHLQNAEGHFCYALTTCGDSIGKTMELLNKELAAASLPTASSMFSLIMPESYVCLPFMYTDTPEREQQKIATAKEQLNQFARMIAERTENEIHTTRGVAPWVMSHVIGNYFNGHMISDRKFTVDVEACIHCGQCAKVCPTGDLVFDGKTPSWQHNGDCTCCLACYHHCPKNAINYGRITKKRGQYFYGHRAAH